MISSTNFRPEHYWEIKELPKHHIPVIYPLVGYKWEYKKYHGAPRDWIDPIEVARLAAELEAKNKENERLLQLKLENEKIQEEKRKQEEARILIGEDEDWDDMLNA